MTDAVEALFAVTVDIVDSRRFSISTSLIYGC